MVQMEGRKRYANSSPHYSLQSSILRLTHLSLDSLPYNRSMTKACMQTIKHGGLGAPVFTAASVLADMTVSANSVHVRELLEDGILETITHAFAAEYEAVEDSPKYQGKTLFQLLRVLQNLSDFPATALAIRQHDDEKLVRLLVSSGFSIERGAADSWVQPLSDIFASLLKSELATSTPSKSSSRLLEVPNLCKMLHGRVLPYYDPYTSPLGELLIESLANYLSSLPGNASEKFHLLQRLPHGRKSQNSRLRQITDLIEGRAADGSFLHDVIAISLQVAQSYWTTPFSTKRTDVTTKALSSTLHSISGLLSEQELQLLERLESDFLSHQAAAKPKDDSIHHEPILYDMGSRPWHALVPRDSLNPSILAEREQVLQSFHTLVSALPPSILDARDVNECLKTLLLATRSLDEDVMYAVSKRGTWLDDLVHTWLIANSPSNAISTQLSSSAPSSGPSATEDVEDWEVCPVRRPSIDGASPRLTASIRQRSVELLSRLSSIPAVASKISVARCLCGIQLEHGPVADLAQNQLKDSDNSSMMPYEGEEDDLEVARRTIDQLRPIQTIIHNVARYAPRHLNAVHIQRFVTMNPSEMESLILVSNISAEKPVAEIILSDHMLSHLAFSRLEIASKLAPYNKLAPKRGQKAVLAVEPLPLADDEYVHFTTRLALQTISNLAKANPQATLSKLTSSKGLTFLQRCVASTDQIFKGLSVLTLARLSSTISAQEEALKKAGKRVTSTIDPTLLDGVEILFPSTKPKRNATAAQAVPAPDVDVITDEMFDVVFIHGINGHPITTWRVETPADANQNRITLWPKSMAKKTKEHIDETYRAYMRTLSDPEKALRDAEAEQALCWPRDWMPLYLPESRILTVSYDIALTKWSASETMPLKRRAAEIMTKLRILGIGERPVIFVAHSFGGLIVKEMLQDSINQEEYRDILSKTRGIIFFSTPHRGSILAGYATGATDLLFRGSTAVVELYPTNWYLHHLNDIFPKIAPHVPTLSIGETETCFLESFGSSLSTIGADKYTCYQIVPDESSNPNWGGDSHEFTKLLYNHRQVCKPESAADHRFQLVLDFFRKYAPGAGDSTAGQKSDSDAPL